MGPTCSLPRRHNFMPFSDVCEEAPRFLLWSPNGLNELPERHFGFSFILIVQSTIVFFNRPVLIRTQILVHRWGPSTRISALFTEISSVAHANPYGSLHHETCTVAAKALPRPQSLAITFWRISELIINY